MVAQTGRVDDDVLTWVAEELADLEGVRAICLGGSRATGSHRPDSDWDLALYYRGRFSPDELRAKGWPGEVFEVGAWGGGVMNGGAWLEIEGRHVDIHYRDLDDVERWCAEAERGRFEVQQLLFYVAGIPTYVVAGELAINQALVGDLPKPAFPDALASSASARWHDDAVASLAYGQAALAQRGDTTVAVANAVRAVLQASHGRLAARREWVLNEKGLAERADLQEVVTWVLGASTPDGLAEALARAATEITGR